MPGATHVVTSFTGGELSKYAEGRFDKPDYKTSLRTCINAFPLEAGAWTRRPGTAFAGTTLNGAPGRVIGFSFSQAAPITIELTDGNMRFREGLSLVAGTIATPWAGGSWATLRMVQAETTGFMLAGTVPPQALVATPGAPPSFALNPTVFNDGPYLDPLTNGAQLTPGSKSGIVTLTLAFPAYNSALAYAKGAFVTSSAVNYVSLVDQNVGNTPVSSPSDWQATPAGAAINNGKGFLGTDVGRLIRLFSEPAAWASGGSYSIGQIVSYNPSGQPNASVYWSSLVNTNTGNVPGQDVSKWALVTVQGAALWTWGKITSLSNAIAGATGTNIGNMTSAGGLAASFDGIPAKVAASSSEQSTSGGALGINTSLSLDSFVGKNYGGQQVMQVTVFPSADAGFGIGSYIGGSGGVLVPYSYVPTLTLNLRGKATNPASPSDGTLLGTSGVISNTVSPVTIVSNDQATSWNYIWVEEIATFVNTASGCSSYSFSSAIAQVEFFSPPGSGTSAGINVEILGPALLYTNVITNWRLGVYSNTTGWPNVGCWTDGGRLWLSSAAFPNRFDACFANGVNGGTVNFAPTDQYGVVTDAHAISETFNSDSVNPILWMLPVKEGIIMGTQQGERLVFAPGQGAISPLNIDSVRQTRIGSEFILPARTEHTTIFVKRFGRKLMEYFPDVYSGRYTAPNLADKAQHIPRSGIEELAYTEAVNPQIWGRCADGSFFSITYKRDTLTTSQGPAFYGWARQSLGTGRVVESICSGPSVGGDLDTLTMVTNDPVTNIRHVEVLTDTPDELTGIASSWYLDDAVNPSSITISGANAVINGLSHLEGKTVQVFAKGLDLGDPGDEKGAVNPTDFVVTNGSITVSYGDGISAGPGSGLFTQAFAAGLALTDVVVGMAYNSDGQIVRPLMPADSGSRSGPAFGLISRSHRISFGLVNSLGLWVGPSFDKGKLRRATLKKSDDVTVWKSSDGLYTGLHGETADDNYGRDNAPCWRFNRVFPGTITQFAVNISSQDQ